MFKFFIWKKSMMLRVNIEFLIIIAYSLLFLELIIVFIGDLHKAEAEARILLNIRSCYYTCHMFDLETYELLEGKGSI